jgi:hypothetical protein
MFASPGLRTVKEWGLTVLTAPMAQGWLTPVVAPRGG